MSKAVDSAALGILSVLVFIVIGFAFSFISKTLDIGKLEKDEVKKRVAELEALKEQGRVTEKEYQERMVKVVSRI